MTTCFYSAMCACPCQLVAETCIKLFFGNLFHSFLACTITA